MSEQHDSENSFSLVIITLLKGVMYADDNPRLWQNLLTLQARVRDYTKEIGLGLHISEEEGYAWLRTLEPQDGAPELPRLISRRQLSYPVSLLLALLRRRVAEHEATSSEGRLIMSRQDAAEMIRTFLPSSTNEARIVNQIDTYLKKAAEMGFIRFLRNNKEDFEVLSIIKAFVDAQWLSEFDKHIQEYLIAGSVIDSSGETSSDE